MKKYIVSTILLLMLFQACVSKEKDVDSSPKDLGIASDLKTTTDKNVKLLCGASTVFRGECSNKCPEPCICITFYDPKVPGFAPYQMCATPCSIPGSCPGNRRCSVLVDVNVSKKTICLPEKIETPPATGKVFLDCFPTNNSSVPRCKNGYLVQYQPFFINGSLTGSFCADVLIEKCNGGCIKADSGSAICNKVIDGGLVVNDSGMNACCPTTFFGACRVLGGPKLPPHGCKMSCCSTCNWNTGFENGCPTWVPRNRDSGLDAPKKWN